MIVVQAGYAAYVQPSNVAFFLVLLLHCGNDFDDSLSMDTP